MASDRSSCGWPPAVVTSKVTGFNAVCKSLAGRHCISPLMPAGKGAGERVHWLVSSGARPWNLCAGDRPMQMERRCSHWSVFARGTIARSRKTFASRASSDFNLPKSRPQEYQESDNRYVDVTGYRRCLPVVDHDENSLSLLRTCWQFNEVGKRLFPTLDLRLSPATSEVRVSKWETELCDLLSVVQAVCERRRGKFGWPARQLDDLLHRDGSYSGRIRAICLLRMRGGRVQVDSKRLRVAQIYNLFLAGPPKLRLATASGRMIRPSNAPSGARH